MLSISDVIKKRVTNLQVRDDYVTTTHTIEIDLDIVILFSIVV